MKNAICILCNNTDYLKAFIDNFQYKNNKEIDLILINEVRIGNKIDKIKEICNGISNIIVINGNVIIDKFKKEISNHKFVDEYTMGLNILQQWYVFKYMNYNKVLVLDDDVIINNIDNILNYDISLFYLFRLSAGGKTYSENSKPYKMLIRAMDNIFELGINEGNYTTIWTNNHINAGERLYVRKDFKLDEYEKYLKRFYENQYIRYLWSIRKKPGSFYLDEWFESFYAYKTKIINDILRVNKLAYIEISNNERIDFTKYTAVKKYSIWHNATCSHKLNWLNSLKENKLIKGL